LPLSELVADGAFREDLLYRINTVEVHLPPLRERQPDIEPMARHFLDLYGRRYRKPGMSISAGALAHLRKYHWPGNVRELQHAIERAVIMADSSALRPEDFSLESPGRRSEGLMLNNYNLEEVETAVIRKVLARHGGNISHAAAELGLTRASLYRRLQKHEL
jgi:DNA-binding NtrC family response regulator